ncbi:MAG TPA: UvrB/UvrC motif-containing protein, partial [Spirochaetia bacterium]|nr:UvrB/UvrC motif-containing protein [Spirochaetia bacterium]
GAESEALRNQLEKAVELEDYERAAELRDQIRKIESNV